ncbi:hypothetical protein BvCmsB5655_03649 [Escherichia coli]|uniref:hypothetical protein n=1 Tax=Escherichia coli TaxID=562 RepID=UPI0010BAFED2|nr:hypothetical protein [Escherichia coli]WGM49366.1 hypothetical protein EcMJ_124 [Escherichia phage vB_Ec-M-J]GCJ80832.1 hypothetical protein BvCmsB5655_03649 [Escherichia coli]
MSKDLSFSNAQKIAQNIIKLHKFLLTVKENIILPRCTLYAYKNYLSMNSNLLHTTDENFCGIRVLDDAPTGDFISYCFHTSDSFKYYHPRFNDDEYEYDTFNVRSEEEFFQYSTLYNERIVFSSTIFTVLKDELNDADDRFYMDLNFVDEIIEYMEKNGL